VNPEIAFFGYAAAAVAFAILTVLLFTVWRKRIRGSLLPVACVVSVAWAVTLAYGNLEPAFFGSNVYFAEFVHDTVWLFCLSSLVGGAVGASSRWLVRWGGVTLGSGLLVAGLLLEFGGLGARFPDAMSQLLVIGSIATSLFALVGIEQLYRNARPKQQNGLKFLCLGLAGIFAYDVFLYSNAIAEGQIGGRFWGARGYVVALCLPLIGISVKRITSWSRGIFASRQVVFYTTTLFAAGIYLTLIGFAGYFIQSLGREWGDVLQLVFFSAAVLAFFVLAMSEQLRARIRVWLIKHFFERKYDYRAEWLRLIHTLTTTEDGLPLKKRAIKSLADIVDSSSGHLWMLDESGENFESVSSWNVQPVAEKIAASTLFADFMVNKGWVIDVDELATNPSRYESLSKDGLTDSLRKSGFIIPLVHEGALLGFTALSKPKTPTKLNFEDHDLLKTAGRQIASYLAQEKATERLTESLQFEAYNRFTAFVMHDLKNAIAQQSLVVENAERHKRNPEFIDDAMEAIKGSVTRMRRVLGHLRQGTMDQSTERVDLTKLLLQVQSHVADRQPVPDMELPQSPVIVQANRERLESAITHAIRNAQDASKADDTVEVCLERMESGCVIRIRDTGSGMDEAFIRERLFRPFDSTKGAEGMGIGAYQIRETIRASGGDVSVESEPGTGTILNLRLPLARVAGG
jgi:putative PEP-CTERM system histidine kinase